MEVWNVATSKQGDDNTTMSIEHVPEKHQTTHKFLMTQEEIQSIINGESDKWTIAFKQQIDYVRQYVEEVGYAMRHPKQCPVAHQMFIQSGFYERMRDKLKAHIRPTQEKVKTMIKDIDVQKAAWDGPYQILSVIREKFSEIYNTEYHQYLYDEKVARHPDNPQHLPPLYNQTFYEKY